MALALIPALTLNLFLNLNLAALEIKKKIKSKIMKSAEGPHQFCDGIIWQSSAHLLPSAPLEVSPCLSKQSNWSP